MAPLAEYLATIGLGRILGELALSLSLGALIAITYVRAYRGFYHSKSFVHTCVVAVPLVAVAVRAVVDAATKSEASAVAFALVGLLGLIRLRTVVRDTREFTFALLALVTGACIGAGAYPLAVLSCAGLLAVLVGLEVYDFGAPSAPSLRVKLRGQPDSFSTYRDALTQGASRLEGTAVRQASAEAADFTFEIVARSGEDIAAVARRLWAMDGVTEVSVIRLQRARAADGEEG
jgi:hypothetical protein